MDHPEFLCVDCKFDTWHDEYYMVHDSVWVQEAKMPKRSGMLCIGCLEARIGRRLVRADFTDFPINHGVFVQSERLKERLNARRLQDPA